MTNPKYATKTHRKLRQHWRPIVAAGEAWCMEDQCLMPSRWIAPEDEWDLAHADDDLSYKGPAHAGCNRSEGARRGNRQRANNTLRRLVL